LENIAPAYLVMRWQYQMRQHALLWRVRCWFTDAKCAGDPVRPQRLQQIELPVARCRGAPVGQVDDFALARPIDRGVRLLDETLEPFRQPMIAAGLPALAVHPLLHDHPLAVIGDDEAVQVEIEAVLNGGAVDLGDEPAGLRQPRAVEADPLANRDQLVRGLPRMPAAAAADMDAQLAAERRQPALQRADDAGGDPRGVPV